jgi:hypothetical protein
MRNFQESMMWREMASGFQGPASHNHPEIRREWPRALELRRSVFEEGDGVFALAGCEGSSIHVHIQKGARLANLIVQCA